jgi:hypothetical protein
VTTLNNRYFFQGCIIHIPYFIKGVFNVDINGTSVCWLGRST